MTEEWNMTLVCSVRLLSDEKSEYRVSTAEDFELQVRRLDEMGKIIDTLTTMLTKPRQPQGSATENVEVAAGCVRDSDDATSAS